MTLPANIVIVVQTKLIVLAAPDRRSARWDAARENDDRRDREYDCD